MMADDEKLRIREEHRRGFSLTDIADAHGISQSYCKEIIYGSIQRKPAPKPPGSRVGMIKYRQALARIAALERQLAEMIDKGESDGRSKV